MQHRGQNTIDASLDPLQRRDRVMKNPNERCVSKLTIAKDRSIVRRKIRLFVRGLFSIGGDEFGVETMTILKEGILNDAFIRLGDSFLVLDGEILKLLLELFH